MAEASAPQPRFALGRRHRRVEKLGWANIGRRCRETILGAFSTAPSRVGVSKTAQSRAPHADSSVHTAYPCVRAAIPSCRCGRRNVDPESGKRRDRARAAIRLARAAIRLVRWIDNSDDPVTPPATLKASDRMDL